MPSRITTDRDELAKLVSPLIRHELASIGAITSASRSEKHSGYVILFQAAKMGKQANVEQMNTLLRMADLKEVESGGLVEPMLRLQTLALQKAGLTPMLQALRLVEEMMVKRYAAAVAKLEGFERRVMEKILNRATKQLMILVAHVAQRKDGVSSHAELLPLPLSSYFATEEDRVCMRCLLDRPGEQGALEKKNPDTYVCAGCHDEVAADFPADLQSQMDRWSAEARRDRIIHKALGRPDKLRAIKEVQAIMAGLESEMPPSVARHHDERQLTPASGRREAQPPASDLELSREGATPDELAYTDLLFDFRSVRRNW